MSRIDPESSLIEFLSPLFKYALAEGLSEGSEIANLCTGDKDVDIEGLLLFLVLLAEEVPPDLFVFQICDYD